VEKVLALALESRGAVWHDTAALGCSNFSAKVGLARLAELAFLTFRGAVRRSESGQWYLSSDTY
jgi:hypothetical protein